MGRKRKARRSGIIKEREREKRMVDKRKNLVITAQRIN